MSKARCLSIKPHRVLSLAAGACGIICGAMMASPAAAAVSVCIDPGHGGSDPGAMGCGQKEAEINLSVSLKLEALLRAAGATVYMTRTADETRSLAQRASYANSKNVNRFVSIHTNSGGGTGIETHCRRGSAATSPSKTTAAAIQSRMVAAWPLPNRGVKEAGYYVLVHTTVPATLTELGFIDKCDVDVTYLKSDEHRNSAACAHLKALASQLGLPESCGSPADPTGKALGTVFEDQGSGTGDMSKRLTGATVKVQETGDTTTTTGDQSLFTFTLPPGSYVLQASFDNYKTGSVNCTVEANKDNWCSIGLFKGETTVDAGPQPSDSGVDSGPDEPAVDAALDVKKDTSGHGDTSDTGTRRDGDATEPSDTDDSDGGCDCAYVRGDVRPGSGIGWLALMGTLMGTVAVVMRRKSAGKARNARRTVRTASEIQTAQADRTTRKTTRAIAMSGLSITTALLVAAGVAGSVSAGCESSGKVAEPGQGVGQGIAKQALAKTQATRNKATGPRLVSVQRVVEGDYVYPTLSPDGQRIAVTRGGLDGLWVADTATGAMQELSSAPRSGYYPEWRRDSLALAWRDGSASADKAESHADQVRVFADVKGRAVPSFVRAQAVSVRQTRQDRIVLRQGDSEVVIDDGKDTYFSPFVAGDGKHVVYSGLNGGLFVYDVQQKKTVSLGEGTYPAISGNGRWLAFEKTMDDGHELLAGDLYLCDLSTGAYQVEPLTSTLRVIERTPSLSYDGTRVAFSTADGVYVGVIVR